MRICVLKILSVHHTSIACMAITYSTLLSTSQYLFPCVRYHFFPLEVNTVRLKILITI